MTVRLFILIVFLAAGAGRALAQDIASFNLAGVRSREEYGPFPFRSGTLLKLESGIFELNVLADDKAFTLRDTETGQRYGVYELVLGRMIDIGDVLFTITAIRQPSPRSEAPASAGLPFLRDLEVGLRASLLHDIHYRWTLAGDGGDEEIFRLREMTARIRKGIFSMEAGLITEAEWDHTIPGNENTFLDAGLQDGSGVFVAAGLQVPVFTEGRWSLSLHGETRYRRMELSLQYGTWEIESVTSTSIVDTNAVTNAVSTTTQLRFNRYDRPAVLTETRVVTGARLSYHAPFWFLYAGLNAIPWEDTRLDAVITSDDRKYRIRFERKDPLTAYGGVGLDLWGVRTHLHVEGGGELAVHLGVSRAF